MSGFQKGKKKKIKVKKCAGLLSPLDVTSAEGEGLATIRGYAATIASLFTSLRSETPICNQNTDPQDLENKVFISYPGATM